MVSITILFLEGFENDNIIQLDLQSEYNGKLEA